MQSKFQTGENITYKSSVGEHRKGVIKQIMEKNGEVFYQIASEGASIVEINENKIMTLLNE
tara:strand:+ start:1178 stop:1360 length:183 start_codon:yes stop_codon:yes gene_type:complete